MSKYYSISELSNRMGIPVSTLRYYQRNRLFMPVVKDKNNSYSYYSSEQLSTLEMITFLRELGVPIKTIQEIIRQSLGHQEIIKKLHEHRTILEAQINDLQHMLEKVTQTEERFKAKEERELPFDVVLEKSCGERWFISTPTEEFGLDDGEAWHFPIMKALHPAIKDCDYPRVIYSMGGVAPWSNYRKMQKVQYSALYIEPVEYPNPSLAGKRCIITEQPAGKYLVVRFHNSNESRLRAYHLLWDYVVENKCETEQFVYDGIIDCVLPPVNAMERIYELHLKLVE